MSGPRFLLDLAASPADLPPPARRWRCHSAGHIVIACFGVGIPVITVFAEWRFLRTGEETYRLLAHRALYEHQSRVSLLGIKQLT